MKNITKSKEPRTQITEVKWRNILLFLFISLCSVLCVLSSVSFADDLHARSALVMDALTGKILFAKNPDLKLPAASTIKIMTAIIVAEKADLNKITTISRRAANQQPSKVNLKRGDRIRMKYLLYAALMESANDAATALAEAVTGNERKFVRLMNQKAFEIGATNTRYINANGLPGKGQYTTAYDLAKIMQYAIRIPVIREVLTTKVKEISTVGGRNIFVRNTNRLLWEDNDFMGGKTGFTRKAKHCIVAAANKENTELIITVLGSPSRQNLWSESERLFGKGSKISNMQDGPVIYITAKDTKQKTGIKKVSAKKIISKGKKHKRHLKNVRKKVSNGTRIVEEGKHKNIQG